MKRILRTLLTALCAFACCASFSGCESGQDDSSISSQKESGVVVQYICSGMDNSEIPPISVIESNKQIEEYYLEYRQIEGSDDEGRPLYDLDMSNRVSGSSFKDAVGKYDDVYFAEHFLVLLSISEGTLALTHEVTSIDFGAEENIINLAEETGRGGWFIMSYWHIIIEISREECLNKTFVINLTSL